MNYIIINESKFEILNDPKMVFPPKHLWSSWSEWDIRIKSTDNIKLERGDYKTNMKLNGEYFDVDFKLQCIRKLSDLNDGKVFKLLVMDFNKENSELIDKRDLIISELFD